MEPLSNARGSVAQMHADDESMRDMLLNQILELQNANDQLTSKLFGERQKSATQITQAFQKYRIERQKDSDRIEDLQNELAAVERRAELLQNELDRNRQLCGFAHNKLIQLQNSLDSSLARNEDLQKEIDSVGLENAQLRLACDSYASSLAPSAKTQPTSDVPGCCETCRIIREVAGCVPPPDSLLKLITSAMILVPKTDMSAQTDAVNRLDRFAQTEFSNDGSTTRPSSTATSPGRAGSLEIEEGEILQAMEAKRLPKNSAGTQDFNDCSNTQRRRNIAVKKRRKCSTRPIAH